MSAQPQSFENHAKMVPGYHYVAFSLVMVLLITAVVNLVRNPGMSAVLDLALPVALLLIAFYARVFALGAQDRVIRLEERLRMAEVLPEELKPRIHEISTDAIIGLRFAPDDELPGLVQRVLGGELTTRKEIKAAVNNWRPDHQRV